MVIQDLLDVRVTHAPVPGILTAHDHSHHHYHCHYDHYGEDVLPVMMVAALWGHPLVPTHRVLPGEPATVRRGELGRGRAHQHHQEDQRHPRGDEN